MSPEFKSFLQGLLNKTPSERLSWPELLTHPFIDETEQEKKDRKIRHEFYTNWAANEHHSGGKQNHSEVFELDADPGSHESELLNEAMSDVHLPNFKFREYPSLDDEDPFGSPRIKDEIWNAFENQSKNAAGCTQLRHDPDLLDNTIKVLIYTPAELNTSAKKNQLKSALATLQNVIKMGKVKDPQQDILKSSSLPTLLINLLKSTLANDMFTSAAEIVADIIVCITELSKLFFTKTEGISPLFLKTIVQILTEIIKRADQPLTQLNAIKSLGIFAAQACIVPTRSQQFFKDIIDNNIVGQLAAIIKEVCGSGAKPKAVHKVAVHLLATLINPAFGDSFSFPWLRGPHDQMNEYSDHVPTFEQIRIDTYKYLYGFDFCKALINIYHAEEEAEHLMTKVAVYRVVAQLIRLKEAQLKTAGMGQCSPPSEMMGKSQMLVHTLNSTMTTSKDHILKAQAIFILYLLTKANFRRVGKTTGIESLALEASTIYKLFEDNCTSNDPKVLVSVIASGLLAEMIGFDDKTAKFILSKFTGTAGASSLTKLVTLIDINSTANRNEMRFLQGTNFGSPYSGFYDQPLNLLNKIQSKHMEQFPDVLQKDLLQGQNGSLGDIIMAFLLNLSSKTEMSPKGFVSLMSFVHDAINSDNKPFMQKIFKNCLKLLCSLVRENQLLAIQEWPTSSGGGNPAACFITTHILRIFNIPFV